MGADRLPVARRAVRAASARPSACSSRATSSTTRTSATCCSARSSPGHRASRTRPTSRSGCSPRSASTRRRWDPTQSRRGRLPPGALDGRRPRRGGARVGRAARRASSGARRPTSRAGPASSATRIPTCCAPETVAEMCRAADDGRPRSVEARLGARDLHSGATATGSSPGHSGGMNGLPLELRVRPARPDGRRAPDEREHELAGRGARRGARGQGGRRAPRAARAMAPGRGAARQSSTACSATGGRRAASSSSRTATATLQASAAGSTADPAVFETRRRRPLRGSSPAASAASRSRSCATERAGRSKLSGRRTR